MVRDRLDGRGVVEALKAAAGERVGKSRESRELR